MSITRRRLYVGVAGIMLVSAQAALADAPAFCPHVGGKPDGKIDSTANINKEDLAGAAIDRGGISRPFERRLRAVTLTPGLSFWQTVIVRGQKLCKPEKAGAPSDPDAIDCTKAERSALGSAVTAFDEYLGQADVFVLTSPGFDRDAEKFFKDSNRTLRCIAPPEPAPSAAASAGDGGSGDADNGSSKGFDFTRFRVRGSASDLIYLQGSSGYADADKAKLEFGDDRDAGKRTVKFVGAVGYGFTFRDFQDKATKDHISYGIVPYFAINLDTSTTDGQPKKVSSDVLEFGSVFEYRRASTFGTKYDHFTSYVSAAPRFLFNRDDKSNLFGFDLLYRPTFKVLNSLRPISKNSVIYWDIIGDVRLDNGIWLRRGNRSVADTRDFSRLGGRIGLGFSTMGGPIPAELTVTDTYLVTLAGEPGHLSLLKSNLSIYFNKDKNFGVDFGYSRGRYQDLDPRVEAWTFGFAVKY